MRRRRTIYRRALKPPVTPAKTPRHRHCHFSIYTAQRRTKEIGIRKVMGASTADITRLLLWTFSKPVLWASLLARPIAAWRMNRWLQGFAYRVPLGWWWLPVATLIGLGIALLTVSAHSIALARSRPSTALRYE